MAGKFRPYSRRDRRQSARGEPATQRRSRAIAGESLVGGFGPVVGRDGVFHTSRFFAVALRGRVNGGDQLLRHAAVGANTPATDRLRSRQRGPDAPHVGAVNVRRELRLLRRTTHRIGPKHIMASGALPPGFPAVEIDGERVGWWLVSNTPLGWMVDAGPAKDTLVFRSICERAGQFPATRASRPAEIQYSSRTRAGQLFKQLQPSQEPGGGCLLPAAGTGDTPEGRVAHLRAQVGT